jgi:hypothetical protein
MHSRMKIPSISTMALVSALVLIVPDIALGITIIPNVTAVTDMGSLNADTTPDKMLDGSGLSGADSTSFAGLHDDADQTGWKSIPGITKGFITFNLGGLYDLDAFGVWNHAQLNGDRGVRDVFVEVSTNGTDFAPLAGGPMLFARAPAAPVSSQVFSFSPTPAAYVRFAVIDGYGAVNTGLSEVRFSGTSDAPEPGGLLLFGASLAGLLWYGTRKAN